MKQILYSIYDVIFLFFEKYFKLHITRSHFYSPILNSNDLNKELYSKKYSIDNLNLNINKQIKLIEKFSNTYSKEFLPYENGGLTRVDAFILYSFIRDKKPKKIVEIGYGASTGIILNAITYNKIDSNFYTIDPFVKINKYKYNNQINLIKKKVQDIDLKFFKDVDLLFIDSSHVSKAGSDVNFQLFEIIPSMKKNSIVHWHDIFIPFNYPKNFLQNKNHNMYWNESYFVYSFLLYNYDFEILYSGRYLQKEKFKFLEKKFPFLKTYNLMSSLYVEKLK